MERVIILRSSREREIFFLEHRCKFEGEAKLHEINIYREKFNLATDLVGTQAGQCTNTIEGKFFNSRYKFFFFFEIF